MANELHKYILTQFWIESMTVPHHWLRNAPQPLKKFIVNRIQCTLEAIAVQQWPHVYGIDNQTELLL